MVSAVRTIVPLSTSITVDDLQSLDGDLRGVTTTKKEKRNVAGEDYLQDVNSPGYGCPFPLRDKKGYCDFYLTILSSIFS